MKRRRTYTRDFKISVIREVEMGKTLAQVSRENEIHPSLVVKWKKEYFRDPKMPFMAMATGAYKGQARMVELERMVGQLYVENEFLKKALTRLEGKNKEEEIKEARGVKYMLIKESLESGSQISVNRATQLLGVSRCGFYKWLRHSKTWQMNAIPDMDVRNEIQRIAVEFQTFSFLWIGVRSWSNSTPHATMHNLGS